MRELPILMNGVAVRGTLDGTKTQTRRPIRFGLNIPHPGAEGQMVLGDWPLSRLVEFRAGVLRYECQTEVDDFVRDSVRCPYGQPGDLLYVREAWGLPASCNHLKPSEMVPNDRGTSVQTSERGFTGPLCYAESYLGPPQGRAWEDAPWRPSIHMPKWAARIWLRVTDVRVERVRDISPGDAMREGVGPTDHADLYYDALDGTSVVDQFAELWDSTYTEPELRWAANPWLWVISYERCEAPR